MAVIGYGICLAISLVIIISMAIKNYDNVDIYYWTLIILNPIIILGYMLRAMVTTPSAYYTTMCFIYIDSTVFISVVLLSLLRIIGVKPRPLTKIITYGLAFLHMVMVILCSGTDLYLTDIVIKKNIFGYYADYVDGPLKIIHYVYMVVLFLVMIGILVSGYMRKGTYSRRTLIVYTSALVIGLTVYVIETLTGFRFTFLP
ncbi:MAG: hypothetical protein MJ236_05210, partial [Clostridia bacterium]|nr:hypothetical protein [Clostridia bacterium]